MDFQKNFQARAESKNEPKKTADEDKGWKNSEPGCEMAGYNEIQKS
jgi:hypothetical protein